MTLSPRRQARCLEPDVEREDFEAECAGCRLDLAQLQRRKGTREIGKDSKSAQTRNNLAQELESLPGSIGPLTRYAGNVAARPRQGRDEAAADRIARRREHDRDHRRGLLCCEDRRGVMRENNIDLQTDELSRDLGVALRTSFRPAVLDRDIATLKPTKFSEPLHEGGDPLGCDRRRRRAHKSDGGRLT